MADNADNADKIVLIHGAFHGGWCWREVANRLRADGHEVLPLTLTGLGERAHLIGPDVDLDTHIADIVGAVEAAELDRFVLVAHSYGGMPAAAAADRLADRISALVLLDSFIPDDGKSALDLRMSDPSVVPHPDPADGFSVPPPNAEVFGLTGDLAVWANRRLTPHPAGSMTQPIRLSGAWLGVPRKVYIRMTGNQAAYFDRSYAIAEADADWVALRRDGPHNAMMTDPDWFVGVLAEHALSG